MRIPLKKITDQVLRDFDACRLGRSQFNDIFPEGWEPTVETALPHARALDWSWGALNLLTEQGYELWHEVAARSTEDFRRARMMLSKDDPTYEQQCDDLRRIYCEIRARAFVEQFQANAIDDEQLDDPNEALTGLRALLENGLNELDYEDLEKLRRKWLAFDAYLCKGGQLPDAWAHAS